MLSAGDSHTAALADSGQVYLWGTFRDSSGAIGLVEAMNIEKLPVQILSTVRIVKIASGGDHLVMLSSDGQIWTMGNSEQGQLGRINEKFAHTAQPLVALPLSHLRRELVARAAPPLDLLVRAPLRPAQRALGLCTQTALASLVTHIHGHRMARRRRDVPVDMNWAQLTCTSVTLQVGL